MFQKSHFYRKKKVTMSKYVCGMTKYRRRQWHPTPVLLPGESHGWRSLVGCSPWGGEELDATEWLHFHFSLSCIGEGNGNPLQCSCLENPRDRGACWAAVYGVTQSRTRLKELSSTFIIDYLWRRASQNPRWKFASYTTGTRVSPKKVIKTILLLYSLYLFLAKVILY